MIIGEKVCLGPILLPDAPVIFNWHNTAEVMHLDGGYRPVSQRNFDEWFAAIGKDSSRVVFSIRRKPELDFLGYVQVQSIHPQHHSAELGIMIGEPVNRGKGYGQEALRLCIGYCWGELNLRRLSLLVVGDNEAAKAAYARAGFEREGVLRKAIYLNGAYEDATIMGLLRA